MQSGVEPNDRRQTWQGFGDGLSQAMEMAVTPVLFALIGVFLDGRLGTAPLLAVGLAIFAMVGSFVKAYYVYQYKSKLDEEARPWGTRPR